MRKILFTSLATLGLFATAQTVTWTSSHPDIVSVNENGTVEMISEPAATTNVTITATTQQNGKTLTSVKTVQVDSCTACFTFNSLTYCGVKLSNGQCWLDRNIGANRVATSLNDTQSYGLWIGEAQKAASCPSGWSVPSPEQWYSALTTMLGRTINAQTSHGGRDACGGIDPIEVFNSPMKIPAAGWNGSYYSNDIWYFHTSNPQSQLGTRPSCGCCAPIIYGPRNASTSMRCIKG